MVTKMVAGVAIVLGLSVLGVAPANANGEPSEPNISPPNPFADLTCNCQPQAPSSGPVMSDLERGLLDGLAG